MQHEPDESKERLAKKPGDVLSQWWTLGVLLRDKRRAASHDAVYWVIINSRDKNTGICRASMRFIEHALNGSISSRETIKKAVHDLTEWGYVKPLPRRRRNEATKFEIPWVISSRGLIHQTTETRGLVEQNAGGLKQQNAGGLVEQNESYQHPDGSTGGDVGNVSPPAAADGLSATARGEGCDDAFDAYGNFGTFHLALKEWVKIDFDRYPAAHIFERAESWNASAKPGQPRMPFEKWLAQKRYAEADRSVGVKPKAKKSKTTPPKQASKPPSPANDNEPAKKLVAIEGKIISDEEYTKWIKLRVAEPGRLADASKPDRWLEICYESADAGQQEQGQKELDSLCSAIGLDQIEDTDELLDKPFMFVDDRVSETYEFWAAESEDKNAVSQIS
ncbi:hypothetical protein [Maritalea sp. S77]|uniref:hypothetical protein n=1 Tax=Maritalea sp. S77 TaxID=3415125 RepID=UPI003C7E341C